MELFVLLKFQLVTVLCVLQLELNVLLLVLHDLELFLDLDQRFVHVANHPLLVLDLAPQDTIQLAQFFRRLLFVCLNDECVFRLLLQRLVKCSELFYLPLVALVLLHEQGILLHRIVKLRLEPLGRSFLLVLES